MTMIWMEASVSTVGATRVRLFQSRCFTKPNTLSWCDMSGCISDDLNTKAVVGGDARSREHTEGRLKRLDTEPFNPKSERSLSFCFCPD